MSIPKEKWPEDLTGCKVVTTCGRTGSVAWHDIDGLHVIYVPELGHRITATVAEVLAVPRKLLTPQELATATGMWCTVDSSGIVQLWEQTPKPSCAWWDGDVPASRSQVYELVSRNVTDLSDIPKDWQECIWAPLPTVEGS